MEKASKSARFLDSWTGIPNCLGHATTGSVGMPFINTATAGGNQDPGTDFVPEDLICVQSGPIVVRKAVAPCSMQRRSR